MAPQLLLCLKLFHKYVIDLISFPLYILYAYASFYMHTQRIKGKLGVTVF